MEESVVEFEIGRPYLPTLFHIAVFKIAVPLFNEFGAEILEGAYAKIKCDNTERFNESNHMVERAKEKLLLIPALLRHSVFTAVMGMPPAIHEWKDDNSLDIEEETECTFYWRFDGLIDTTKTVQELVVNTNISIKERFDLSCRYCLEKSVLSLWAEMKESDKTKYLRRTYSIGAADEHVASFWVKWICEGSRVPWIQAFKDYFNPDKPLMGVQIPKRHTFFPLLLPEERRHFLITFGWVFPDDAQFCLHAITKEEKECFFEGCFGELLNRYLQWPLQSLFLEKVKKLFPYMKDYRYEITLHSIWFYHEHFRRKDFDYYNLFVDLWTVTPQHLRDQHLRECTEKCIVVKEDLDKCFDEMRQKRF